MRKAALPFDRTLMRTIGAMALGVVLMASLSSWAGAQAGGRKKTPATPHLSGAERSLIVLKEISAKLTRIEGRLERLERIANKLDQ